MLVQEFAEFGEFLFRAESAPTKSTLAEPLTRGSADRRQAGAVSTLAGPCRLIDMRALLLIAADQPFLCHDLHEFQNRAVLRGTPLADNVKHLAHRGWPNTPEQGENFELGVNDRSSPCSPRRIDRQQSHPAEPPLRAPPFHPKSNEYQPQRHSLRDTSCASFPESVQRPHL